MPMRYANEDDVLNQLRKTADDAEYARLVRLENGLCDMLDHKTGTSFGTAPVAETRSVSLEFGVGVGYGYSPSPVYYWTPLRGGSHRLVLDTPLRSLTGIETGGTWNGATWDDGTALTTDEYRLTNQTDQGSYAIDLVSGTWGGVVRITGIWGDQATETVPDDVREAMTFLTINEWHQRNASPFGQIGPDGILVTPRNPWGFEVVKAAIDRHRVVEVLV